MTPEILIRVEGYAGRITLNRPEVLNALSHGMVGAIARALDDWEKDDAVRLVMIEGAGDRAFSAGGDIQLLYHEGRGNPEVGRRFWVDEYRLNARIHHYPKPYVALIDGIVMGGGAGVSIHGSHRVVTERAVAAMPEAGIGFMPDVGSTRLLADAPGWTGFHLGLTAYRMKAGDAIYAGFADCFVPSDKLGGLAKALTESGDASVIPRFGAQAPAPDLGARRRDIDRIYGHDSLVDIVKALEAGTSQWERETLKALRRVSPFSAAAAFEALRRAKKTKDIETCLLNEYRFAYRSLEGHEFFEGIRAAVIDKDREPKWKPARIEDVDAASVAAVFAPLGDRDWRPVQ